MSLASTQASRSRVSRSKRNSTVNDIDKELEVAAKSLDNLSAKSKGSKHAPSSKLNPRTGKTIMEGAYPQDKSVNSNHTSTVPTTIFTPGKGIETSSKRYQIYVTPESPRDLTKHCFMPYGDGTTFCIDINCKVNHRGSGERILVAPGDAFIEFSKTRAYKEPVVNSLLWEESVYNDWISTSTTMEDWIQRFKLVRSNLEQEPDAQVTMVHIKEEEAFTQKVKNLQSVRKRNRPEVPDIKPIEYTLGCDFGIKPEDGYSLETIAEAVSVLDATMHAMIKNFETLFVYQNNFEKLAKPSLTQSEEALKELGITVGTKPTTMLDNLHGPTIWSTLGLMNAEFHNLSNQVHFEWTKGLKKVQENTVTEMNEKTEPQFQALHDRLDRIAKSLSSVTSAVQDAIDTQGLGHNTQQEVHEPKSAFDVESKTFLGDSSGVSSDSENYSEDDENALIDQKSFKRRREHQPEGGEKGNKMPRLSKLEEEIKILKSLRDDDAATFCGLHIKSKDQSDVWLLRYPPGSVFGIIVDTHAVCEHIYSLMFARDSTLT